MTSRFSLSVCTATQAGKVPVEGCAIIDEVIEVAPEMDHGKSKGNKPVYDS